MQHDASYQDLFSHPEMVADLLRGFVGEPWVQEADFSTLEKVSGSYVSDDLRTREADLVWRVRLRDGWLYVYLLLEFQSSVEQYMAVRVMTYIGLLYQDLIRRDLAPGGQLPPVVPLVLYNGLARWQAPVDIADLVASGPRELAIYRPQVRYLAIELDSASDMTDWKDIRDMLAERVIEWTKDRNQMGLEEGRRAGLQQGLQQGQIAGARESVLAALSLRFGRLPLAVEDAVNRIADLPRLRALLQRAILAGSLAEFTVALAADSNPAEAAA